MNTKQGIMTKIETIKLNLFYLIFLSIVNLPFNIISFIYIYNAFGFFTLFPLIVFWAVVTLGMLILLRKQYNVMDELILKLFIENERLKNKL